MTLVVDASFMVAWLVDGGPTGTWAGEVLAGRALAAPHLVHAEVANVLRRAVRSGDLSADLAAIAHGDMLDLRVELFPYEPFAGRVWELHDNLTSDDAWYVALAEWLVPPAGTPFRVVARFARLVRPPSSPSRDSASPKPGSDLRSVVLDAPLATVDHRLARASGPRCPFLTPA